MDKQRFQAKIVISGTRVIIPLPFNPNEEWGKKERHHIHGAVEGYPFRGPLGSDADQYFLALSASWRRENHLEVGDVVEVVISPEGPQIDALAEDISAALNSEPEAREFFEALPTFYRKGYLRWIDSTKKRPDIRAARIAEMVTLLKNGKKQR